MPAAADQHFERPHGPERDQYNEAFVRNNDPRFFVFLQLQIIAKQTTFMFLEIVLLRRKFARGRLNLVKSFASSFKTVWSLNSVRIVI